MFYLKDLGSLLDSIHEIDPDANPMAMIKFTLPDGSTAKATYVHESMDGDVGSQGTIILDAGDIHTEFDSMQYAVDGIEGLMRQGQMASDPYEPVAEEEKVDYASLSADDLANEVDYYLRNNYPGANWVSDKELSDGSLALMIDWGNNNVDEIKPALKSQFGDRISFINTTPEAGGVGIIVNALERKPVNESMDFDNEFGDYYSDLRAEEAEQDAEAENYQEMTEEGVQGILNKLGLSVVNKWYDGNRSRPVFDCRKGNGETICVWTEPPYEAKVWFKDREPGNNRFTEDIITLDSLEYELNNLLDEISPTEEELNAAAEKISAPDYHAEGAYEDLTDIGGDFESVQSAPRMEAVNADSVSYEVTVTDLNVKSRAYVKIISEDTALLNTIFNYFISVSTRPALVYQLADSPNIYLDGMVRHYDEEYKTPYLETNANVVQTPNNLLPNPARHLTLDDVHIEKLKESRLQSIVLDNLKRFVNQAIAYGAAHPEKNLSVVDVPNPRMLITEDDPREFAYDESVEFYKDIKAVCDIAGKPALAEAVIKLHKAYHPVMESGESPDEDSMNRFKQIFNEMNLTEYTNDNIRKVLDTDNFTFDEKVRLWRALATEEEDDEDDDDDDIPASSDGAICMICGNPCSISCFQGGSVVCPDCQAKRSSSHSSALGNYRFYPWLR